MPYTTCAYEGCSNSKRTKPSLNFHRFPKNEERRTEWILRTGNLALLDVSESAMENKRLCSEHFSDNDVKLFSISRGSNILKDTALPKDYSLLSADDVSQVVTREPIDHQPVAANIDCDPAVPVQGSHNLQLPIVSKKEDPPIARADQPSISASQINTHKDEELVAKLQAQLAAANKKLNSLKNAIAISHQNELNKLKNKVIRYQKIVKGQSKKIKNLESKVKKNEEEATFHKHLKQLSKSILDFFHMQVDHHAKLKSWTDEEKEFSMSLYQKSPKAYCYLRDEKEFALPCVTLIQRWNKSVLKPQESDNQT